MADFSTPIDIACATSTDEVLSSSITGNANGAAGTFNSGANVPAGCTITSEEITFTISGETFGPFSTLPATVGPIAAGTYAGVGFNLSGASINSFSITPDAGYNGEIVVSVSYEAEGDTCGTTTSSDSITLDWINPIANIIDPPVNNGGGNYVFDSSNSSDTSCPSGINAYLWTVYASDGITELLAGTDYVLNSADLMQSTLDATFATGSYVVQLTVTTDCGTNSSTQNLNVVLIAQREFTGSNSTDINAVVVTTGGTVDGSGAAIEDDVTALYNDVFNSGPCGTTTGVIFEVMGNAGSAPTFTNWNPALTAGEQAAISALFAGTIGSTGYSFDKEAVRDILVLNGLWTDGQEICVEGTVTYNGSTSAVNTYEIETALELTNYFYAVVGASGPFSPAQEVRLGLAFGRHDAGSFNFTTAPSFTNATELYYEGNSAGNHSQTDPLTQLSAPTLFPVAITQLDAPLYSSIDFDSNVTGLSSFASQYNQYTTNPDNTQPAFASNVRIETASVTPWTYNAVTGVAQISQGIIPTGTVFAGDAIAAPTVEVRRFAQGAGGIDVVGVNDSNNGTTPQRGNIAAGSAQTYAATSPGFLTVEFTPDVSGDYFAKVSGTTTSGQYLEHISSARFKLI